MGNRPKPRAGSNDGVVETTVVQGSSKKFWTDQITEGLKQYPKVATPGIPKLGQSSYNPKNPYFNQFVWEYPIVPPIMNIRYVPNFGTPEGVDDPSNLDGVFSNIIATLRQKCTTAYNYDQGTLAAAIMGAGTIPVLCAHIKRRLKSLYTNSLGSNLSTDDIWAAFSDGEWAQVPDKSLVFRDLDDLVGVFNDIVDVYNSIAPPNFFPVFRRWEEMESEVFRDLDDDPHGCAQLYYFSAGGYYFPEESTDPINPGFVLKWKSYFGDLKTELNHIYSLAKWLQNNQDMVQVYGDICKTYGDERYKIDKISPDYKEIKGGLTTVYDATINFSLYHATVLPLEPSDVYVKAANGRLVGGLDFASDQKAIPQVYTTLKAALRTPKMFNAQKFDEDFAFIAECSQWMISDDDYMVNGNHIVNVGTDVLTDIIIWTYTIEHGVRVLRPISTGTNFFMDNYDPFAEDSRVMTVAQLRLIGAIESFAYAPMVFIANVDNNNNFSLISTNAELEYPTFITPDVLGQWHDGMRYRLWGLPHLVQLEADGKAKAYWN